MTDDESKLIKQSASEHARPSTRPHPLPDYPRSARGSSWIRFLEGTAGADIIVSGGSHLLALGSHQRIGVLTPADALRLILTER
jgi:hypothetical protein